MSEIDLTRKELYSLKSDEFVKRDISSDIFSRHMKDFLNVHTHQLFCRNFFNADTKHRGLILEHDCHVAGTQVLVVSSMSGSLYDGTLKNVEDVNVGDILFTQGGLSIVTALSTGTQSTVSVNYTVGSFNYTVVCNSDHLLTVRDPAGLITDLPVSSLLGSNLQYGLLRPWATGYSSSIYLYGFSQRMQGYDNRTVPSLELRTYASLCGYKFTNVGSSLSPFYYIIERDTQTSIPFVATSGPAQTYYGFTLASWPDPLLTNDTYKRYILVGGILTHNTGTGKTLTACAIIKTFLDSYKKMYNTLETKELSFGLEKIAKLNSETPYVLVVGFEGTQEAFFRELTNYPEFGFVTPMERDTFHRYKSESERTDATIEDHRRYRDMYLKIRKRLTDKSSGGFFDFKGFQELVNFLFDTRDSNISLDFIEKESSRSGRSVQEIFEEMISSGVFKPRMDNLLKYKNSLVVTDELHNTYNSVGKNSRGIVLQYLLDNIPGVRFLGLSATLLNSSPAEFIDVLNYLLVKKLRRDDYFDESSGLPKFKRPSVPQELGLISQGFFSFLKDSNPKYYPKMIFSGTELKTDTGIVKYQRFTQVPMSESQQRAHEEVIAEHGLDNGRIRVPVTSEIVFDMTLPLPGHKVLTSTDQVSRILSHAPESFLDQNNISIYRDNDGLRLGGQIFMKENLKEWSPKYVEMLNILDREHGKCVIFHKKVRGSGVLMIEEILKNNGFIGEDAEAHAWTKCSKCGLTLKEHKKTGHDFVPLRYLMAYGQNKADVPKILQMYNAANNSDGTRFKVLIGSKVIRETYDFKDVRHILVVDCPTNLSMTIQLYGRAVRNNSHIRLPREDWTVNIWTIVSVVNKKYESSVNDSAEVQRYKLKMDAYILIQEVDKYRHAYAVDAAINRGTIWPNGDPGKDSLGALYYDPMNTVQDHLNLDSLNTKNFRANKFFKYEMNTLSLIIKRLMLRKKIWTYQELWKNVKNPPFQVETNPNLFDEDLFKIVLSQLINSPNFNENSQGNVSQGVIVNRLADPNERRLVLETGSYRIVHMHENGDEKSGYYILVPCDQQGKPVIDSGIFEQNVPTDSRRRLGIDKLISGSHLQKRYLKIRGSIIDSLEGAEDLDDFANFLLSWPVDFQELFIQDCIRIQARVKVQDLDRDADSLKSSSLLILSGLEVLGTTISYNEIEVYKQSQKYFKKALPGDTIVGYESKESIKIMNNEGQFTDVAKSVFNRMDIFRMSDPITGVIESSGGIVPKFKLRSSDGDERGIVCHTKSKEQLLEIMKSINIKPDSHRTKAYCRDIFLKLLDLEIQARENESKDKYIYFWWNELANTL